MVIAFMHFDPIRALYWSAVINGVTAVPIMLIMMLMACSRRVMGEFAVKGILSWGGWVSLAAGIVLIVVSSPAKSQPKA